jgi:hypothetical protein
MCVCVCVCVCSPSLSPSHSPSLSPSLSLPLCISLSSSVSLCTYSLEREVRPVSSPAGRLLSLLPLRYLGWGECGVQSVRGGGGGGGVEAWLRGGGHGW